ncbi:BTB/POZ domain-containing protein [Ditylenchus destructor]|uniref:BTB/POZ domain-containing protein n=1 Tax=Ditylenchus destructor TaxID=166010 RepID=A0AAD4MUP8_9BILA|nr:BTB/POZ domain-containing protein [Ditylenchus destructor]
METNDPSRAKFELRIENFPKFVKAEAKHSGGIIVGQFTCSVTASVKRIKEYGRICLMVELIQSKKRNDVNVGNLVIAKVCLKSGGPAAPLKAKIIDGKPHRLGFAEQILKPSYGFLTHDNAIVLDVELVVNKRSAINEISLVVPDVHEWTSLPSSASHLKSQYIESANARWCLLASITKEQRDPAIVALHLDCAPIHATSAEWSCLCSGNFLIKYSDTAAYIRSFCHLFNNNADRDGFPSFITTEMLLEDSNIFGTKYIELVVQFTRVEPLFIELDPAAQVFYTGFSEQIPLNGTLLINNSQVTINKELLAEYSPFFRALFSSDFQEKSMNEITLIDVEENEFKELLSVLYPRYCPITDENVKFLLRLGDRFQIDFVLNACERFLLSSWSIERHNDIIALANKFSRQWLLDSCLAKTSNEDSIRALDTQTWTGLDPAIKKRLNCFSFSQL